MVRPNCYAIDFGTSNSLLAASHAGGTIDPIVLDTNHSEPTIMRSLMYFSNDESISFGATAIQRYVDEAGEGRFIRSIKKHLPSSSFTGTRINNQFYKIEELVGCFLRELKGKADQHFGQGVDSVVLGRPARFANDDEADRLAQNRLEQAAREAGFKNIDFFAEPLAAAYDYRKEITAEKILLVVDLGGGTSDFTVIKLQPHSSQSQPSARDVLAIGGVSVAGDALDGAIMTHKLSKHFGAEVQYRMPMSKNILTMPQRIKYNLGSPADITLMSKSDIVRFLDEVKKCTLSEKDDESMQRLFHLISENLGFAIFEEIEQGKREACIHQHYKFDFSKLDLELSDSLDYDEFLNLTHEKLKSIIGTMDEVIQMAGVKFEQIDAICCTGGTSKVPEIRQQLLQRFGSDKIHSFKNFHSVIQGLSERAANL